MKNSKEDKNKSNKMVLISAILFGFIIGICLSINTNEINTILFGIILVITGLLQIIIHELGHLFFGILSGYKFIAIGFCGIAIYHYPDGYKLKKMIIPGASGYCQMKPNRSVEKTNVGLYLMGGVLANAISILISILLIIFTTVNGYILLLIVMNIVIGSLFIVLNWLPLKLGILNDGQQFKDTKDNKESRIILYKSMELTAEYICGRMISEILSPAELDTEESEKNINGFIYELMKVNAYYEKLDFKLAQEKLERLAQENLPEMVKLEYSREIFFVEIMRENGDKDKIENLHSELKRYLKITKDQPSTQRTIYAYEILNKKDNKRSGKKAKKKFEQTLKGHPYLGAIKTENILIDYIETKVEQ